MRCVLLLLFSLGCRVPAIEEVEETSEPIGLNEIEPDAGVDEIEVEEEVEEEPERVAAIGIAVDMQQSPYRDARYIARCRVESRVDAEEVDTLESKTEARTRARAMARAGELDPVLIFARMAYGESGTPQPGRNDQEYLAMLAVMDSLRGGMSRVEMFVNYAPRRVIPHPEDVRQRWVAELQLDGARPPSWPAPRQRRFHTYPGWRDYGCPRWLATVSAVQRLLRDNPRRVVAGPCTEIPDHWGGAMDQPRADRAGWRRIECGATLNRFFVVPERVALRDLPGQVEVVDEPTDADHESPEAESRPPESIQRRDIPSTRQMVLDLHGVRGHGQRQADEPAGDQS